MADLNLFWSQIWEVVVEQSFQRPAVRVQGSVAAADIRFPFQKVIHYVMLVLEDFRVPVSAITAHLPSVSSRCHGGRLLDPARPDCIARLSGVV